ncbi:hypothetical protein QIY50_24830 [Pseudomonas putida]|nr:hypothetical protein QIY50_24830 [Pseudomonas putida]
MDTNKMRDISREQFEAWAAKNYVVPPGVGHLFVRAELGDGYRLSNINHAWHGWKASRESLVVKLPPVRPEPVLTEEAHKADGEASTWSMWAGEKLAKEDCREAIEAQGLKVAP